MPKVSIDPKSNMTTSNFITYPFTFVDEHIGYLNNSKFFAGIIMILLNIGSKFINVQFSRSAEEYLKYSITKQVLVFAMAWMGTRDIYTALSLTAIFVILSEYLFNEESEYCVVPYKYRVLHAIIDENKDGIISQAEIDDAVEILKKAKKQKQLQEQKKAFNRFKQNVEDDSSDIIVQSSMLN